MGRRDNNFVNDDRADAALRRLLARIGEPTQVEPPPDLVTRTARRLPAEPPALAARRMARRRALRLGLWAAACAALALIALLGVWGTLGGGPQIALLFGDGGSGLSRALLILQLLAKPLVRTIGAAGAPLLLAGAAAVAGAGWLWWRLIRRDLSYAYAGTGP